MNTVNMYRERGGFSRCQQQVSAGVLEDNHLRIRTTRVAKIGSEFTEGRRMNKKGKEKKAIRGQKRGIQMAEQSGGKKRRNEKKDSGKRKRVNESKNEYAEDES